MRILPENIPNTGYTFVNHEQNRRSGHLSHALVEYAPGHIMAFYSNCSGTRNRWAPGHNGFGWLEYKTSPDWGASWSEAKVLDYSYNSLINEPYTVSCEKAVSPEENVIVAICIRNENPNGWEPYLTPVVLRSEDAGESWSAAYELCPEKGRVYDAFFHNGAIYAMLCANDDFLCAKPEHRYHIYKSTDGGRSFALLSELPGDTFHRGYGSMAVREDGAFIAYTYNADDEYNLDYYISYDGGTSWSESGRSFCARRIRNPQVARVRGGYILHGRSGCVDQTLPMEFVLYTSKDGINWDKGHILCAIKGPAAYYSNNLVLDLPDGRERVLIQSSVPYDRGCVNVAHWWLDID